MLKYNVAQRKLEQDKMRRFLRDNESIPIPAEMNIMRFIASIDRRRRKQLGFDRVIPKKTPKPKPVAKKRKYKKKTPKKSPVKRKKVESDYENDASEPEEEERDILQGELTMINQHF